MNRPRPHHPFQLAIEQAWDQGHAPRLLVLGDRVGGGLPAHVVAAHDGMPIVLDLDPTYPMRPRFDADCAELVLSFSGIATTCVIPWTAIMVVVDAATGYGFARVAPAAPARKTRDEEAAMLRADARKGWPQRREAPVSNLPVRGAVQVQTPKPGVSNAPREARPWAPRVLRGGKNDDDKKED